MSLVNYSVAPRRQELFLDPKLETDKGRLPIKVVKAANEKLQFPTGKNIYIFQASKPHPNTNRVSNLRLSFRSMYIGRSRRSGKEQNDIIQERIEENKHNLCFPCSSRLFKALHIASITAFQQGQENCFKKSRKRKSSKTE